MLQTAVMAVVGGLSRAFMGGLCSTRIEGADVLHAALERPPGQVLRLGMQRGLGQDNTGFCFARVYVVECVARGTGAAVHCAVWRIASYPLPQGLGTSGKR